MNEMLDLARRHVAEGKAIVERQRALVLKLEGRGGGAAAAHAHDARSMLQSFEETLKIFEGHLKSLEKGIGDR